MEKNKPHITIIMCTIFEIMFSSDMANNFLKIDDDVDDYEFKISFHGQ